MDTMTLEIKNHFSNPLLLYLTGSRLINMSDAASDTDIYGFYLPTKFEFLQLNANKNGHHYTGTNYEAQVFMSSHLFRLLEKTNPNIIEMFFKKPIWLEPEFTELAKWLYNNREQLVQINRNRFIRAAYGMMKDNLRKFTPNHLYYGNGRFGKDVYNFRKSYRYAMAVICQQPLEPLIFQQGDNLKRAKQIKALTKFNPEILKQLEIDKSMIQVRDAIMTLKEENNNQHILKDIAERLPIYKEG